MHYGVDVALRRTDDLDKLMIADVSARVARGELPLVLDIGCGAGGQARRLASHGAQVHAVDINEYQQDFVSDSAVSFTQADITSWIENSTINFDMVCFQRTLHYLPYTQAKSLLAKLKERTSGTLYLSVTGATSAIARAYPALNQPLEKRFDILESTGQAIFSITAPLCIYTENEVINLLRSTGWKVIQPRVSDFGNIKVVACAQ